MVDISSGDKKINITVSTSGNKASVNATPDTAMYYSNKSREWAISNKIVDNEDYSSKYYANVSKQNADKSTVNLENLTTNYNEYKTELENTKNISVEEIETAKTNAISDITNQENLSVDNVNTAGATQVNLATEQATIATEQAAIATAKTSEVVESGNATLNNISNAKTEALGAITEQETTSKNNIETKGAEQITLIQNEGATQIANVQSTGFYMRDDKLYFINSQGEETEFKSGGSGLEVGDIGMALYVDETKGLRRYLNGQIVDINTNTQAFLNRLNDITALHPSLLCTEDEWQTAKTMSAFGQVGRFVFNYADDGETVVSVRIPRVVNVQGLFDLQNLGLTVEAGLPEHAHSYAEAIFDQGHGGQHPVVSSSNVNATTGKASASNPIYGNSDTVQPEAIQYPYFIQIATGSETENNIVNDIELNNPFSLFDSKYSDHELHNISWLKSEGQWNSGTIYVDAYNLLLRVYNSVETVNGLSVKLSTEEYTDYDYVLNTADETFRLPLKNHTADDGNSVLTLYYYVGETVQNANLIDAGRIAEALTEALAKPHIIDTYVNGASGYRIWSDGYCEQWGRFSGYNNTVTITFLKEWKDINYGIYQGEIGRAGADPYVNGVFYSSFTTISVKAVLRNDGTNTYMWKAYGYLKEGQY